MTKLQKHMTKFGFDIKNAFHNGHLKNDIAMGVIGLCQREGRGALTETDDKIENFPGIASPFPVSRFRGNR